MSSGALHPNVQCVIGNGVVLSLEALDKELKGLEELGVTFTNRFFVSSGCALILPSHISIDKVRADKIVGTTGRGIGPAYRDRIERVGIRFADIINIVEDNEELSTI